MTPRPAGRPAIRLAALLAAVVAVAGALTWLAPVAAAQGAPGTGSHLRITEQTAMVGRTGVLALRLQVDRAGLTGPLAVRVDRYDTIHLDPAGDPRGRLDDWMKGDIPPGSPNSSTDAVPFDELDQGVLRVPLTPDQRNVDGKSLLVTDAGVFPLVVRLLADGRDVDRVTTFLIRLPDSQTAPPLLVTPVVGIRAPVALRPDGSTHLDAADVARIQGAQTVLSEHAKAPLAVDLRPETLAALAHQNLSSVNKDTLRAAVGDRAVLAPTLVDVDADRWLASGLRDQLGRQRILGRDAVTQILGPTTTVDSATWIARRPLGAAALGQLAEFGVERLVLPAEDVAPVDPRAVAASEAPDAALRPFDVEHPRGRTPAVLTDQRLNRRLAATGDPVRDAQATLADLTILACGTKLGGNGHCNTLPRVQRAVVLDAPDDVQGGKALDLVLDALQGSPGTGTPLRLADLDDAFALPAVPAARGGGPLVRAYPGPVPPPASLGSYPTRLKAVADRVWGFRNMLEAAVPADTPRHDEDLAGAREPADLLLQRLDVSGATDAPGGADQYLDAVAAEVQANLSSVVAPAHDPITLTSPDGEIQVRVENRLKHDVAVRLELTADTPLFPAGRSTTVTEVLPAESSRNIPVQVRAVSSGSFPLQVTILSPDRQVTVQTVHLEVRSTVVSFLGLALTVAAGVFLLLWWGRHFRDTRRARKLVAADEVPEAVAMATGEVPAVAGVGAGSGPGDAGHH